jgi:ABC-type amino acid transport substrate-binding protein
MTSAANAEVRLGVYAIPGLFTADKSGDYDKILSRAFAIANLDVSYIRAEPEQIEADFKSNKLDCVIPLDERFWSESGKFFNSAPLNTAKIYIFSGKDDGPYTSFEQLKGKKVGARQGMPYGPKFDAAKLNAVLVNDDDENAKKLAAGSIDAFVAYVPDMWVWSVTRRSTLPNHDRAKPADVHRDAFLCRDTQAARDFVKAFDNAVKTMKSSEELQKLLGRSYVP